jgi:hypothetical protein
MGYRGEFLLVMPIKITDIKKQYRAYRISVRKGEPEAFLKTELQVGYIFSKSSMVPPN